MNKFIIHKSCLFIFNLMLCVFANAQWYNADKVNKKAIALYNKGYEEAIAGNTINAIATLSEALKIDPKYLDAATARADMYVRQKNYKSAVSDYEFCVISDTVFANQYLVQYAISLAGIGNFNKALWVVNKYLANKNIGERDRKVALAKKANYEFALDFEKNNTIKNYVFAPINMGDSINSENLEYLPSITVDGNKFIFNKRINGDEDFYESNKINGVWQKATPIKGRLNTNFNEGAQNISQDGQWLIFTGCDYPEGQGSCDLYISYKSKNGEWSEAKNLGNVVNSDAWESSPSLSPDKSDLYFASTRPGGFGGSDIWVSHSINGKWQQPENMGANFNTIADESCPFIHADNQTLFFNSSGLPGYGSNDLFVARRNEKGIWQQPINLGYPINTIDNEGSMIVAADGKTAYYASDKGDYKNKIDLYSFILKDDVQAQKTLWVKGKIFDKKTNMPLPSTVQLTAINTGIAVSNLQADEDGNYLTTLPVGKNYAFNVNRKGYLLFSETYNMQANISDSAMVVNIGLQPLEKGASIILKNIFFKSKSAVLDETSFGELNKVAALMNENVKLIIAINGFTDNVGKPADNILLSNNRSKAVMLYLQKQGVVAQRLIGKGFGETKPVANNNTELGKAQNRRIEMVVISN